MARISDDARVLWLLKEQGRLSNRYVRSALNMSDDRYEAVRSKLINQGLVEKVKGQGGGIQLTKKGYEQDTIKEFSSSVSKEKDLYAPFLKIIEDEAKENDENALTLDTSALRRGGKWTNPDITKISVQNFPILNKKNVIITTYELKQWGRWNVEAAFESASHRRFSHQAFVVLEWAKEQDVIGLDEMAAACGRFGIGLIIMKPYYSSFRLERIIDAVPNTPTDGDIEDYLGYILEKSELKLKFQNMISPKIL